MSSHHFVKDQQEPAVFILDAEDFLLAQIEPLLEWVPTVLVTEKSLDKVLSWGIKVDAILASEAFQLENPELLEEQYPVKSINSSDENYLQTGIEYLLSIGQKSVHLVGISHVKALELHNQLEQINLTIIDGDWKYYPVKSGEFKKWFAEGNIHIHGEEGMPVQIKNENGEMILPITYATMLEVPEGTTEIKASGIFWIGEIVAR